MLNAGIIFSFVALFAWGFGDFFIQKTVRQIGIWKSLFFIGVLGSAGLFVFIRKELLTVVSQPSNIYLLILLSVVSVIFVLFYLSALKQGKIAVVDPITGLELPLTVGLSVVLAGEHLSLFQAILVVLTFFGIIFAVAKEKKHLNIRRLVIEKGAILAGIGAVGMALTNFLTGVSSQQTSPLLTIWFTHIFFVIVTSVYLIFSGGFKNIIQDIKKNSNIIFFQSVLDNIGWIAFAFAMTYISISVATTISESFIVLSVLLGVFISKEKLKRHQFFGIILVIVSILALSMIS
ncbi:MAG: EamA-like protein family transporter [Candidatus Nomurabacteria bacterium GW2011_GWA2_43_15]|uniref:EamA-like protein family transporter n=1 Tax=Candidatus Nomurabacteria bacterium GW2011_GWA2_43_15 TaxID=1618738 RepID=A0A0G1DUF4_9BACT|nr:MAG: EamA-like protein family transporter [Candidatus Nomurabacteria bacterium GW2011_GWA2_43_15]